MNYKYTIYTEIGSSARLSPRQFSQIINLNLHRQDIQQSYVPGAKGLSKIKLISRSVLFTLRQMSQLVFVGS